MLSNATVQYMEDMKKRVREKQFMDEAHAHCLLNWPDWIVTVAFHEEILALKLGYIYTDPPERNHRLTLSTAQRAVLRNDIHEFFIFVYRTWTDDTANAWVGGTWHREGEAWAARMLHSQCKRGLMQQKLNKLPSDINQKWEVFCKLFHV